jgi:hypothetical protein
VGKRPFDLILYLIVLSVGGQGQTILFSESFETDGSGTRYTVFGGFSDNVGDYFVRTDGQNTVDGYKKPSNLPTYTGQDSLYFFAGEDTENPDNPNGTTSGILFNDITISGYDSLLITGLFACGGKPKFDPPDYMHVLVDFDNSGSWVIVGSFEADISSGTNSSVFGLDTDFDGLQDSTVLDTAFKSFSFPVSGTGSLLDVKIELYLSAGDEEAGFDFIRLTGVPAASIIQPSSLSAVTASADQIDLTWTPNADNDSVLIAYDTLGNIGNPIDGNFYNPNDQLNGGGTVLYAGNNSSFSHAGREPGTKYYYKAWSIHNGKYSAGVCDSAVTAFIEPASYPDSFTVQLLGLNAILTWNEPNLPAGSQTSDGYLIVAGSDTNLSRPNDGIVVQEDTVLSDGHGAVLVPSPGNSYIFKQLEINTTYYFDIFPFTNSGTLIDYKTDGSIPHCQITTGNRVVDLFFSEYVEGSSYNKALELFNSSKDTINLAEYRIRSASGGAGFTGQFHPTGRVPPKSVYVIAHSGADNAIIAIADTTLGSGVMSFNGDDARLLERTVDGQEWVPLDLIGDPNHDPGSGWDVAGVGGATQNHTLIRKETVSAGNTNWSASAGSDSVGSEWYVLNKDQFSNLGQHRWELIEIIESGGSTHVLEGSNGDSYSLKLSIQPTATVVISLGSDSQLNVSPNAVSFSPDNWDLPQSILVTPVDDSEIEGDHYGYISHSISSEDGFFNSYSISDLAVAISDNDVAGITIEPNPDLHSLSEGDNGYSYSVMLNTTPSDDVVITASIHPEDEAVLSPTTLTFSSQNWNLTQSITILAVDDSVVEKQDTLILTHHISSNDPNYNNLSVDDIHILLNDNDNYAVVINEIMYNSPGNDEEWIELYCVETNGINFNQDWVLINSDPAWQDTFQTGTVINEGEYFTIQLGSSGNFPFTPDLLLSASSNRLNNTSSTLRLSWDNRVVDSLTYHDSGTWPAKADGQGYSLELKSVTLDNAVGSNWQASLSIGGTPGSPNSKDTLGPQIASLLISQSNAFVDIGFTEGVFGTDSGQGGLSTGCFVLDLVYGNVVSPAIDTVTATDTSALTGGETTIRLFFSYTGKADGNEVLEILPVENRIFDEVGNPASSNQPINTVKLYDQLPPELLTSFPKDDTTGFEITTDIMLLFSENVRAGPGKIVLNRYSDQSVVQIFSAKTEAVIVDNSVKVKPSDALEYATSYYVTVDDTALSDLAGNYFKGVNSREALNFTTKPPPNTAPQISSGGGQDSLFISFPENNRNVLMVTAVDHENDTLTYSLSGGVDAGLFQIDSDSGWLAFLTPPDYEHPEDSDTDNVYVVEVTVTDNNVVPLSDTQVIVVFVTDQDEDPPELVSSDPVNGATGVSVDGMVTMIFNEIILADSGQLALYQYSDDSVVDVLDISNDVKIDSMTLKAVFAQNLSHGTSYYVLIDSTAITDTVGNHYPGIQSKNDFHFETVQKLNTAPVISSNNGLDSAIVSIPENQRDVFTVTASDPDGDTLKFLLSGGEDADCFVLDSLGGVLCFTMDPDFEDPVDKDADNQYHVTVCVSDPGGLMDSQQLTIVVTDLDEISPELTFRLRNSLYQGVTNQNPVPLSVLFSENVMSFSLDSILIENGLIDSSGFTFVSGSDSAQFSVIPRSEGFIEMTVVPGAAKDEAGNSSPESTFKFKYDSTAPVATLESEQSPITNDSLLEISIHFNENVLSFTDEDLKSVPDCKLVSFLKNDPRDYVLTVSPLQEGNYCFYLEPEAVSDSAGNLSSSSDSLFIVYDITPPFLLAEGTKICQEDSESVRFTILGNEDGWVWYSVTKQPTSYFRPEEIISDSGQISVTHASRQIFALEPDTVILSNLERGGRYFIFITLIDRAGNLSEQLAILKIRKYGVPNDLFFSEYLEGSGENKALEIYNPTDVDIRLEDYGVVGSTNGSGWEYCFSFPDSLVIERKKVFVIMNADIDTELDTLFIPSGMFSESGVVQFDGDDARMLISIDTRVVGLDTIRDTTFLDVIGDPNKKPIGGWSVAGVVGATKDHTLVRKQKVQSGNVNWNLSAGDTFQNSEWVVYPKDYFESLGFHVQSTPVMEIYLTASPFDTLIYRRGPTVLFPDLDIQGIAGDTNLSAGTIYVAGWIPDEDSLLVQQCGNIKLKKRPLSDGNFKYELTGRSHCSDYLQTLKSISYFHQNLLYSGHTLEFRISVRVDSIVSYPLCRYLVIEPKQLSVISGEPLVFQLKQNYPNPFNPITNIDFELPYDCQVFLTVYNLHGDEICPLVKGFKTAGHYTVQWVGRDTRGRQISTGVYLYRLKAETRDGHQTFIKTRKLVFLK